ILVVSFFLYAFASHALIVDTPLHDPKQEAVARSIFQNVRCVVCEGQSLADSSAEVAVDMRQEIRRQIESGNSYDDVIAFLVQRYGDEILMRPPLNHRTVLLWVAPLCLLLAGLLLAWNYFGRKPV
ncbi:MAG: cytochrome c-type biogenesis protein CcmH, partial [Alphaproteobacteria bacterium]